MPCRPDVRCGLPALRSLHVGCATPSWLRLPPQPGLHGMGSPSRSRSRQRQFGHPPHGLRGTKPRPVQRAEARKAKMARGHVSLENSPGSTAWAAPHVLVLGKVGHPPQGLRGTKPRPVQRAEARKAKMARGHVSLENSPREPLAFPPPGHGCRGHGWPGSREIRTARSRRSRRRAGRTGRHPTGRSGCRTGGRHWPCPASTSRTAARDG